MLLFGSIFWNIYLFKKTNKTKIPTSLTLPLSCLTVTLKKNLNRWQFTFLVRLHVWTQIYLFLYFCYLINHNLKLIKVLLWNTNFLLYQLLYQIPTGKRCLKCLSLTHLYHMKLIFFFLYTYKIAINN